MFTTGACMIFGSPHQEVSCKRYLLYDMDGGYVGVLMLVYNDAKRWGELYTMTEWGDYMYRWNAVDQKGFVRFLQDIDAGYMTEKLIMGAAGKSYEKGLAVKVIPAIKRLMAATQRAAERATEDNPFLGFMLGDEDYLVMSINA